MRLRYRLPIQVLAYWLPVAAGAYLLATAISATELMLIALIIAGLALVWLYWWAIVRVRQEMKWKQKRLRRIREIQANLDQFWKEPPR